MNTLQLVEELIRRPSITPDDAGCQAYIAEQLITAGFHPEHLRYGAVDNLWLRRGTASPLFVFAGHTDVVPAGALQDWHSDPFIPTIRGDTLYGRGAADMKSGLAAMTIAAREFTRKHPDHNGSIALLLTSDEEGPALEGTRRVVEYLTRHNIQIDWCIVGEPASDMAIADQIRVGRRGSLTGRLVIHGVQGHVAYPERAANPIHLASAFIHELCRTRWDEGDAQFLPTSLQISNIHAGVGVENVTPGAMEVVFNFRFCTGSTEHGLRQKVADLLAKHELDYSLDWHLSGRPFLTKRGRLVEASHTAIQAITGNSPLESTGGGTSDARFIAPTGAEVIELGVVGRTLHKANECIQLEELDTLVQIYVRILELLLLE